jgi:cytoskeletal protein CcmA (bactofilin family)
MANQDPALDLTQAQWRAIDERRKTAWIGADITIKGTVVCARDLTIDGQVDGAIEVGDHAVVVGVGATIKADLAAKTIKVSGTVTGNVTARELVELRETASIDGDVKAPRLSMADGAQIRGKVETA